MSQPCHPSGAGGDGDARFAALWLAVEQQVLALCRRETHCEDDAQELCQRTRVKAWGKLRGFRGESSFLTWVNAIVRHEAEDLRRRRSRARRREVSLGNDEDSVADGRMPAPPFAADTLARLAAIVPEALAAGHLTREEAAVLSARFQRPAATWAELGKCLRVTAADCRDVYRCAKTKLAVYLVVHCPDWLGGPPAIAAAFESVKAGENHPMTAEEIEAFEGIVLGKRIDHHHRGVQEAFRTACAKVCRKIGPANFTPPPKD